MIHPALPDLAHTQDELASMRERLLAVKASLQKACAELDAQIQSLELLAEPLPSLYNSPNLFETEPVPPVTQPATAQTQEQLPVTSIVLEATKPSSLAPELEQATLEELNNALSQAFAEIAGRYPWAQ